jgi:glyceraldehyde-3-phosphate dehydrogenase/erythrose-4-phosphate dehydrogenase
MSTVAINGLGRIGQAALTIRLDADGLDIVAVSDIADAGPLAAARSARERRTLPQPALASSEPRPAGR